MAKMNYEHVFSSAGFSGEGGGVKLLFVGGFYGKLFFMNEG